LGGQITGYLRVGKTSFGAAIGEISSPVTANINKSSNAYEL
jgi:hypothetical protein